LVTARFRTGSLFYVGGLGVTLLIGVIAALVVGNVAASNTSTPKTSVSVVTTLAGVLVLSYAVWLLLRRRTGRDQMGSVAERDEQGGISTNIVAGHSGAHRRGRRLPRTRRPLHVREQKRHRPRLDRAGVSSGQPGWASA
jgi:hypothetical protein